MIFQHVIGQQETPVISVSSSGLITATAGGKTATQQLTTQGAQTITPGTANKTIASGRYLTGTQTIKGDANLAASNIKSGVSIFGVDGSYQGKELNYWYDAVYTGNIAPTQDVFQFTVTMDEAASGLIAVVMKTELQFWSLFTLPAASRPYVVMMAGINESPVTTLPMSGWTVMLDYMGNPSFVFSNSFNVSLSGNQLRFNATPPSNPAYIPHISSGSSFQYRVDVVYTK